MESGLRSSVRLGPLSSNFAGSQLADDAPRQRSVRGVCIIAQSVSDVNAALFSLRFHLAIGYM